MKREADLADVEARLAGTESRYAALTASLGELQARLSSLRVEVANRLNAVYRMGRPRYLRVLLAAEDPSRMLSAYRTASALSAKDARLMKGFRGERVRVQDEASRLETLRPELERDREARQRALDAARVALERRRALLRSIRSDKTTREAALKELVAAERSLGDVAKGLGGTPAKLGFGRLRGVLEWPSRGQVSSGFGRTLDRDSGSYVEHTGLDIEAAFGSEIKTVAAGSVVFAQWLRGYGLTVIVDHGDGYISVYAHASVLLVSKADSVRRGQKIGLVGDSGSIRGPFLYFEIRKDGKAIDPTGWLRPR